MNALISLAGVSAIMLALGLAVGMLDRKNFAWRWLLVGVGLICVNDLLLTNFYGRLPSLFPASDWNWQGKALALLATLGIASFPQFGWRRSGLTIVQKPGSLRSCVPAAIAYCLFFVAIALAFPNEEASAETIAFQSTMPSLEEETFYRGLLLLALCEAYRGTRRFLGVDWNWGAILSCVAFGLAHAFTYSDGSFAMEWVYFALTAIPSVLAVWMRLRTGSLLLPVLLHSVGNTLPNLM